MLTHLRNQRSSPSGARLQRGVGLVEILIAVLVLSIGLLGMAGLQTFALRNNQSSYQRGMAVVQAYYIADAMRADRTNAINGNFNIAMATATPTAATFAATSLRAWRDVGPGATSGSLVQAMGPGANGSVDCSGHAKDTICDIVVQWDDSRATGGSTTQQMQIRVEL